MKRFIRAYFKANAAGLAQRFAHKSIIYGKGGGYLAASGEGPTRILRAAFERHFANIAHPTAMRLSIDEAGLFPSFKGDGQAGDVVWLVVVSDSNGELAYGMAQEGGPGFDRQIRECVAKIRAQERACEVLLQMRRTDMPTAGSA